MKFLLNRLFKASRAYYLMKEGGIKGTCTRQEADLIKEEMVAALVDVRLNEEGVLPIMMSGEASVAVGDLLKLANRRKEWGVAKILNSPPYQDFSP